MYPEHGEDSDKRYDLESRLIDFAVQIIDVVEEIPSSRAGNHIAGQLVRSGTSPAPNYAESQSAESRRDFIHKLKIAFKELRETKVWLEIVLRKSFYQTRSPVTDASRECDELIRIFGKSISTAEAKEQ
ncbi:MAG: four helix bundle protein [Verrucomicrobia bacterium]|nr:four helix bundle protein [Verrucomicrobiota bacterium]MDA1087140.1 four helix bundle protein [Verrucomicrobiota bacterium]